MGIGERHSLLCHVQAVLVELYGLPIGGVILQQTGLLSNEDFYHERNRLVICTTTGYSVFTSRVSSADTSSSDGSTCVSRSSISILGNFVYVCCCLVDPDRYCYPFPMRQTLSCRADQIL